MSLAWTANLETGIATIDREHQGMLEQIGALALPRGRLESPAELQLLLDLIEEHVTAHFTNEESYMRVLGFPGVFAHMADHARLKEYFAEVREGIERGKPDVDLLRATSRLLANAVMAHIRDVDSVFAEWHRTLTVDQRALRTG